MNNTRVHLPVLQNRAIRLRFREDEAMTRRQSKTVKKLKWDKINAMSEIQALKMRVDVSEENVKEYRRQLDDMTSAMKSQKEKHHLELKTAKVKQSVIEKQLKIMIKQSKAQKETISSMKLENELLERKLFSLRQRSESIKVRAQSTVPQPYRSVKRSASRGSYTKDFPRS